MSSDRERRGTSLTTISKAIPTLLSLLLSAGWSMADEIVLIAGANLKQAIGGRVRGQVESESPTEVVVKLGGTSIPVPIDQIVSVRYDGQPATLQLAETREAAGQLSEAAELFKKAAGEAAEKPFVLQMALYREAAALADLALVEPDRLKDAKDRLRRFVQAYPNSRHIVPAREDLARIQLSTSDFSGAEATIAELARLPKSAERAAVLRAKVLARQGRHDEALSELDRLIGTLPERSTAQREARLAKAESLVGMKKYKDAETLVRQVISDAPAEDVAAQSAAYNTLGDCLRAANHPKEALLAYLHTDLLYGKDKQEHPRALFQIEKLFRFLKQDGRADEYAQRLKLEYPRSLWLSAK
jgi:tetratricopeptide (TPR) repeat protein